MQYGSPSQCFGRHTPFKCRVNWSHFSCTSAASTGRISLIIHFKILEFADSSVGIHVTETRELVLLQSPGGNMFQAMCKSLHISYVEILILFHLQARGVILVLMTWLQFCSWRMARSSLLWYAISLQGNLIIIRWFLRFKALSMFIFLKYEDFHVLQHGVSNSFHALRPVPVGADLAVEYFAGINVCLQLF